MKFTAKYVLVAMLACNASQIYATYYERDYANDGCFRRYECGCNPLYCGAWDLQFQGGVNPIKWNRRGDVYSIGCTDAATSLIASNKIQKFNHGFRTPWIAGLQVGYHWSDNIRAYIEFNYSQAKAKTVVFPTLVEGGEFIGFDTYDKYKLFDAYFGLRNYWDRWCDRIAFFLGAKVGLTHHKSIHGSLSAQAFGGAVTLLATDAVLASSNTVVSGGADFGFDVCICGNWSFVITGSVLASCGPRFNRNLVVPANTVVSTASLLYEGIGTELRFPVTVAVRYSF